MNRGAFRNITKDERDIVHLPPAASIVHWGCVEITVIFARIDMSKVNFGYVPIGLRNEVDSKKRGRQGFYKTFHEGRLLRRSYCYDEPISR